ncbi:hypothetical protein SAMN05216428_102332 [Nitrosospira sp. Nsp11]|uniref:hypothetical protein n=1 Tax=Nitrosospira sp. Nsp11 TaxID=1855338 RepID=UPI000914DAC2|nr:hypothetical protein [Nitrosospira sp. Nsp11]SHL41555.1 hypothetical protein SAMN05216428_102332 [Nitrosospira sp. Nsp11]
MSQNVTYEKINSDDLLYVVTSRGAVDFEKGCVLLQLSVATTVEALPIPTPMMFSIHPEIAQKVISSIQASLARLQATQ